MVSVGEGFGKFSLVRGVVCEAGVGWLVGWFVCSLFVRRGGGRV